MFRSRRRDHELVQRTATLSVALLCALVTSPGSAQERLRLTGSGASFPFPLYSAWLKAFSGTHKGIAVDDQDFLGYLELPSDLTGLRRAAVERIQ